MTTGSVPMMGCGNPTPKRGPIGALNQNLHAGIQHLPGYRAVHREGGLQVGFTWTKCVECLDIGVMGDEDHIEVGCDVPREVGGLGIYLARAVGEGVLDGPTIRSSASTPARRAAANARIITS